MISPHNETIRYGLLDGQLRHISVVEQGLACDCICLECREPLMFHMDGHWDADGTQLADAIRRIVVRRGGAQPKVRAFPWWLVTLAS